MRGRFAVPLGLAVGLAACGGAADTGEPPWRMTAGPIDLGPRAQRNLCVRVKAPADEALEVSSLLSVPGPGVRRVVLYRAQDPIERPQPYECAPLDFLDGRAEPEAGGGAGADTPLFIAQGPAPEAVRVPGDAVLRLRAGEMLRLEVGLANPGDLALRTSTSIDLATYYPDPRRVAAGMLLCGSVAALLPAGGRSSRAPGVIGTGPGIAAGREITLPPGFWRPPAATTVFAMGLHQGPLGAGMTVEKTSSPDTTGTILALHDQPETSPIKAFPPGHALAFRPDEGLRWLCSYRNSGDQDVHFGPAPPGEMCFLSLYHLPARDNGPPWTTPGCWQ